MAAEQLKIKVGGMTCEHCVETIENALKDVDGILAAEVDLPNGVVLVEYDSVRLSAQAIHDAIEELGYEVTR
jgi:copper chaperone